MFIFIVIVLLVIIIVASSRKKQPVIALTRKTSPTPIDYRPVAQINSVALRMATKHFGEEWLRFLTAKNYVPGISLKKIRECVAISYSKMNTKALERLLVSFIKVTTDKDPIRTIGVTLNMENYTALHQAIYELIKSNRFQQASILTTLNLLSDMAHVDHQQNETARKAKLAEDKLKQLELKNRLTEQRQIISKKEAELKMKIAEQRQSAHTKTIQLKNSREEVKQNMTQPEIPKTPFHQNQTFDLSTGIWELAKEPSDESIIEISVENTNIKLPPPDRQSYSTVNINSYPEYDPDQYSLGKKYRKKLNLSPAEVKWLNKFWNYSNVFNSIEGCELEIIKLYLLTIKLLNKRLKKENSSLDEEIEPLKTMTAEFEKSQPNYWQGYDEVYTGGSAESEAYNFVYKKAESVIREQWRHKRKISANFYSRSIEVKDQFDHRLGNMVEEIIEQLIPTISFPDEPTEIALNEATTTRWKTQFQELINNYKADDHSELVTALHRIGKLNSKNPSLEHIYYEASKFMSSLDKVEALKFYLHYIWTDLNSVVIDSKELNKTIQKKLFANEIQLASFQMIIDELIGSRDLKKALKSVEGFYKVKRKNITLNSEVIKRVTEQHSGTVEKLNEYLQDEEEMHQLNLPSIIEIVPVVIQNTTMLSSHSTIPLNQIQLECLRLFENKDHIVNLADIVAFAKVHSLFKNQLIDGINETCYEVFDDVLIEETEEGYAINPNYYTQIIA